MIARNDTGISTGFGPRGLHGYGPNRYPVPVPAYIQLGGATDFVTRLGDISTQDVGLIENLTSDATQAFQSTQPSAVAAATYGGGASGLVPPGVNSGSISFGGSTSILLLIGVGLLAWGMSGKRRN